MKTKYRIVIVVELLVLAIIFILLTIPVKSWLRESLNTGTDEAVDDIFEVFGQGNNGFSVDIAPGYVLSSSNAKHIEIVYHGSEDGVGLSTSTCVPSRVQEIHLNGVYIIARVCRSGEESLELSTYWIVNTDSNNTYGPLTLDSYKEKLLEIGIADVVLEPVIVFVNRAKMKISVSE